MVLASKDAQGEMQVIEAGDHAVRKGATMLGGAGLVVGLFAPPLLAATAVGAGVGAVAGKFAKKRAASGIGDKLDDVLPDGSAALIAIYDSDDADKVKGAIPERHPELGGADRLEERQGAQGRPRGGLRRPERLTGRCGQKSPPAGAERNLPSEDSHETIAAGATTGGARTMSRSAWGRTPGVPKPSC